MEVTFRQIYLLLVLSIWHSHLPGSRLQSSGLFGFAAYNDSFTAALVIEFGAGFWAFTTWLMHTFDSLAFPDCWEPSLKNNKLEALFFFQANLPKGFIFSSPGRVLLSQHSFFHFFPGYCISLQKKSQWNNLANRVHLEVTRKLWMSHDIYLKLVLLHEKKIHSERTYNLWKMSLSSQIQVSGWSLGPCVLRHHKKMQNRWRRVRNCQESPFVLAPHSHPSFWPWVCTMM